MKSRFLLQAATLLAALSLFAGCGGADVGTTPTSTPYTPVTTIDELKAKLDAGSNIVIVDTRSTKNYEKSHIPGAISIPLTDLLDENDNPLAPDDLNERYGYLNSYEEIITY